MLELSRIKNNPEFILEKLKKRGCNVKKEINLIIELDEKRVKNQQILDDILADGNQIAKKIGELARDKKFDLIHELKTQASNLKNESKKLIETDKKLQLDIKNHLTQIPNTPHESVPIGNNENDNIIIENWGRLKKILHCYLIGN